MVSDEMLMAYADGELGAAERAEVDAALRQAVELQQKLRIFLRTRAPIARAFDELLDEPMPQRFVDLIVSGRGTEGNGAGAKDAVSERNGGSFQRPRRTFTSVVGDLLAPLLTPAGVLALASAVALIAGTGLMTGVFPGTGQHRVEGTLVADAGLIKALETTPSRVVVSWPSDGSVAKFMPVLTYVREDGIPCREYLLGGSDGKGTDTIACRSADGAWRVIVSDPSQRVPIPAGGIVPADGLHSDVIGKAIDAAKGEVLDKSGEEALIRKQWRTQ